MTRSPVLTLNNGVKMPALGFGTLDCTAPERIASPIGGVYFKNPTAVQGPLDHPCVVETAAAHGKTPAQIVLRWHLQHGLSAIPKSLRPDRIAENFEIFDFELIADDMAAIDALDTGIASRARSRLRRYQNVQPEGRGLDRERGNDLRPLARKGN
jgi:diketogulonate reductase-like aldo/keto reductase